MSMENRSKTSSKDNLRNHVLFDLLGEFFFVGDANLARVLCFCVLVVRSWVLVEVLARSSITAKCHCTQLLPRPLVQHCGSIGWTWRSGPVSLDSVPNSMQAKARSCARAIKFKLGLESESSTVVILVYALSHFWWEKCGK